MININSKIARGLVMSLVATTIGTLGFIFGKKAGYEKGKIEGTLNCAKNLGWENGGLLARQHPDNSVEVEVEV